MEFENIKIFMEKHNSMVESYKKCNLENHKEVHELAVQLKKFQEEYPNHELIYDFLSKLSQKPKNPMK